ncbi:hypothetical protein ACFE04_009700 [Oxalis oulophora]
MEEVTLPSSTNLQSPILDYLNHNFTTKHDLTQSATQLVSDLQTQCSDLSDNLSELNRKLESSLIAYALYSNRVDGLFTSVNAHLTNLDSLTSTTTSGLDDGRGGDEKRADRKLAEELPALAKEVAKVETVRAYAETALKLDMLIGDIEDAVSFIMNKSLRKYAQNSEKLHLAIQTLQLAENVLNSVTKTRPQWTSLLSAVDHRVDRALAVLRPQAIADHRALLSSLGWPPSLSANPDTGKSTQVPNPLFTMHGDLKNNYCENFVVLCSLQELQRQRKSRQLEGRYREIALCQPLWAIEELVNPISIASQRHFAKWVDKPELIFALVYKVTRDYVDSMDELLQPLVDEAKLIGYSCREEWVSSMVASLSTYLAKEVFPVYIGQMEEESDSERESGVQVQAKTSWLHLVDLMISFDKRIKSLVEQSGILLSLQEDGNLQKISSLSVFCDRPDWLDLWAEIEVTETLDKLKEEMDDKRNWTTKVHETLLLFAPEDYKSPAITGAVLKLFSSAVDRCRSLPTISSRSRFLRLAGTPLIRKFLDNLHTRCLEAEGLTALADDNALIKVANSINAAHYIESVLKEWCEDVFFLEMGLNQSDDPLTSSGVFDEEIEKLEEFRREWAEKMSTVILRGFEAQCQDYLKNRRQWQEKSQEGWTVSKTLVSALDFLQGKVSVIEVNLSRMDFVGFWRNLAAGVDRLFFSGILMSNAKFNDSGVERLSNDLEVLFGVFGAWCIRPQAFFPKMNEGLKWLKMGGKESERGTRQNLSVTEAEKISKNMATGLQESIGELDTRGGQGENVHTE